MPQKDELPRADSCFHPCAALAQTAAAPKAALASQSRISAPSLTLLLLWAEQKSLEVLPKGSASRAASPDPHWARTLPKVNTLRGGLAQGEQWASSHPAARLKSATARFVLCCCASALSLFLSGTRRGRQSVAVFFGVNVGCEFPEAIH